MAASDIYRDILKDKDRMNPRTRSFGALNSGDNDYKNYLAGMRPRTKSNNTTADNKQPSNNKPSFVDSAARRTQNTAHITSMASNKNDARANFVQRGRNKSDSSLDKEDTEKKKQYTELSSVPSRRSVDSTLKKAEDNHAKSKSNDIDFDNLKHAQSDFTGSVGRLRSMFDKGSDVENKTVVQLRGNKGKKDRPHSASFDNIETKSKSKVSGIYNRHSVHVSPLQIDSIITSNGEESESLKEQEVENDQVESKSKGRIDIDSLLAPESTKEEKEEEKKDDVISPRDQEIELQKQLEIDRMKRTQEEIAIEQRFNIKRRTLKERLSDLAGGNENVSSYAPVDSISEDSKPMKVAPPVAAKPSQHPSDKKSKAETEPLSISENNIIKEPSHHTPETPNLQLPEKEASLATEIQTDFYTNDEPIHDSDEVTSSEDKTLPNISLNIQSSSHEKSPIQELSQEVESIVEEKDQVTKDKDVPIPKKDSEESEIDKYRSAVERFDDFINKQENLFGLDEEDPLKDFPNDFTPGDNSKLFDTQSPSQVMPQTEPIKAKGNSKDKNENGSTSSSDLMSSILSHMERSNRENLFSASSEAEPVNQKPPTHDIKCPTHDIKSPTHDIKSPTHDIKSPTHDIKSPTPEAPPRLSKLQGRSSPATSTTQSSVSSNPPKSPPPPVPSSASSVFSEDPFTNKDQYKADPTPPPPPQRPSTLTISQNPPNSTSSTISYMPDSGDSETEESGYYSMNNPNTSDNYNASYQNVNGNIDTESFKLPAPPAKSNLKKSKADKKRKVGFRDGDIQEVVYTYGPIEYDRANADIDPLTSSAEWELEKRVDSMDIFSVDLHKDEKGLGLSIIGLGVGTQKGFEKLGIFVKTLTEGGASQKDGRIQVNDQILEVNGVSLVGVTQYFAAQTLKGANGIVRFLMGREKNKRTQYAPGAPMLDNPDMKKHIDEMNQAMAQVEEYQTRTLEAEHTLEEVKMELLKAEERAHDAEYNLSETKEMLKAATEGSKRSGDKVDDLQRSLKEMTNRLSTSEENLLDLTSKFDVKDKELLEFQEMLEAKHEEERQLSEQNQSISQELGNKSKELEALEQSNHELKTLLEELKSKREEEINLYKDKESHLEDKLEQETKELRASLDDVKTTNEKLKAENAQLSQKISDNDVILGEFATLKKDHSKIKLIEARLEDSENRNSEKDKKIQVLNEKVDYLRSLLVKMEKGAAEKEMENQYIIENNQLKEKVKELEEQLEALKNAPIVKPEVDIHASSTQDTALSIDVDAPNVPLPKRETVVTPPNHIFGIAPPTVDRVLKPISPPLSPSHSDTNDADVGIVLQPSTVDVTDINANTDTTLPTTAIYANTNIQISPKIDTEEAPDIESESSPPNPVPKPPRGHFIPDIEIDDSKKQPEKDITIEKSSLDLKLDSTEPVLTSETITATPPRQRAIPDSLPVLKIPPPPLTTPPNEQATPTIEKIVIDLDASTTMEDSIDDNDQGQFQLIQEDVDEEKISLDEYGGGSGRRHTEPTVKMKRDESQEFFDSSISSVDGEWKRLDKEAEKIAEQVTLQSPNRRKQSTASSSSEDETTKVKKNQNEDPNVDIGRTHSIKIDQSYFQQSPTKINESFDQSVSVLDDSSDNDIADKVSLSKSLSFDSAIPATPVLDNKMAQDKINLKGKRKPPTREGRQQMLDNNENFQSEQPKQSSLPRNLHNNVEVHASMSAAQSVPNLTSNESNGHLDKHEKQKHKFGFHLPKVFKKSKVVKRRSSENEQFAPHQIPKSNSTSAMERPKSAYVLPTQAATEYDVDLSDSRPSTRSPTPNGGGIQMPVDELHAKLNQRSNTPTDSSVVPIRNKTESMSQMHANENGTEEAVVPFHQKEQSMSDDQEIPSTTPSPANINGTLTSPDDVTLELSAPSSSSASSSLFDTPALIQRAGTGSFNRDPTPTNYNERGIDVGVENGTEPTEDEITHWTRRPPTGWDVRQVGLWLVEMNLAQYVNNFKSHNVDGQALLRADGNRLKEYGVANQEHRAEIKKRTKEFRHQFGKDTINGGKGKSKDHKTTKDKLQFWKGKYKPH
ncbi:putative leucine-rich repeat-containing protein DDB_G0290503 isoform X2 [Clytia hemisphaerica]|uniref:Neurabin-1 n=1 Tax=Clytia hemisphaerica TaxID=252671 RepID=A0A7M5UUX7_9CNID